LAAAETAALLGSYPAVDGIPPTLDNRALARGASDNVTAVVIRREA
jgi:hypothetical protein